VAADARRAALACVAWALGLGLAGLLGSLPLVGADFWRLFLFHQMLAITVRALERRAG